MNLIARDVDNDDRKRGDGKFDDCKRCDRW